MSKDIKLTNWQVPRAPEAQQYDAMKQAPPFNPDNYKDVGKIHDTKTIEEVTERMMAKREAVTGIPIDQPESEAPKVNMNGITDDRPKEYWIPPRIGKR